MSKTAFTVKVCGYYLVVLGVALVLMPNLLLGLFGMPVTTEVWIRVLGIVVFNVGVFYVVAAARKAMPLFRASVYTRSLVFLAFIGFAAIGLASPVLVLFGAPISLVPSGHTSLRAARMQRPNPSLQMLEPGR